MNPLRSYIVILSLLLFGYTSTAQMDLTGRWEGIMGRMIFQPRSGQFLQINIVQQGDKICGYTYDSVISSISADHCKAVFQGQYDKRRDMWTLTGTSFIENSGSHVFMRIRIWDQRSISKNKMEAEVGLKAWPEESEIRPTGILGNVFRVFGIEDENSRQGGPEQITLKRVSSSPPDMPDGIAPCFPHLQKPKDSVTNVVVAEKPLPAKPKDTVVAVIPSTDTTKQVLYTPPPVKKNDTVAIAQKMVERKNTVFGHLPINVKNITLNIYDNAIIDGDTVTIFYNGRLLVNKRLLSEKPIVIELALDENAKTHEIVLYAENLGSIPPNTALIVVTAGDKRYELHSSASLEENAVLVFDYSPKGN